MSDLIIRQAAIDVLRTCQTYLFDTHDKDKKISLEDAEYEIERMPSAQPEIIRCCKCVHWQENTIRQNGNDAGWWNEALCKKHTIYGNEPQEAWVDEDWYCADAERREKP